MIDARYEFRHFNTNLSGFREQFRNNSNDEIKRQSEEKYIVSPAIETYNFKLRFDKLDIKELLAVEGKLEQWYPIVKTGFPIEAQLLVEKVCPLMHIHPEIINRSQYTLEEFMAEVVSGQAHLYFADVAKRRFGYSINDCMAEYAEITINGKEVQTLSIESHEPEKILETMKMFGMEGMENISYVKAIKSALGLRK
jgi:hypothetical protein